MIWVLIVAGIGVAWYLIRQGPASTDGIQPGLTRIEAPELRGGLRATWGDPVGPKDKWRRPSGVTFRIEGERIPVAVASAPSIPKNLRVRPLATTWTSGGDNDIGTIDVEEPEHPTGDRAFDQRFFVEAPDAVAFPLLSPASRRLAVRWMERLEDGEVKATLPTDVERFEDLLDHLAGLEELALELADRPASGIEALRTHIAAETLGGARRRYLEVLFRLAGDKARDDARAALDDPDPGVRLVAGEHLGGLDGATAMIGVACAASATASDVQRALDALVSRAGVIDAPSLQRLVDEVRPMLLGPFLERLAPRIDRVDRRRAVLLEACDAGEPLVTIGVLRGVAVIRGHDEAVEARALAALDHFDHDVIRAAITALGACASVRAVPALQALEEREDVDDDEVEAARRAVAAIQSRATGAEAGGLAIAGDDSGGLSVAENSSAGGLSDPDGS